MYQPEAAIQVQQVLIVVLLTLLPALELRASIPYGLLVAQLPLWLVGLLAVAVNWLIAPLVYLGLGVMLKQLQRLRWFSPLWERYAARVQHRTAKAMATWGAWGLALFIGIPLPGTGVYTGAIGAYLLGMELRRFIWVALAGVVLAATLVTIAVLSGSAAWSWAVNTKGAP